MRIGELAALAGVTIRTVRHYHHLGLLPEPARTPGGYRDYRLRDAVLLARVRRLAELGLSLDEIRDVLADDQGRELREVLTDLDADLARQQDAIAGRRARLAALLAEADLNLDSTVASGLGDLLHDIHPGGSAFAALDRDVLSLIDTGADPAAQEEIMAMFQPLTAPDARGRGHALTARMDAIAAADPADPRVAALAAEFAAHLPAEMAAAMVASLAQAESSHWWELMTAELAPAQVEVLRLMVTTLTERGRC
ncbi:MerR family transcriptional regulator [Pilimelia terevasa]|uniref:MerR family transcriptional regulator n=1 Tax=Pilimelia terevasa TaxID=53372 RepID=A0A8J3BNT7_9ACTN|nr:MerR family transcriptional regulator [Pilimelia terevasa]GGK24470.1 MerR family transcriptional regulator [Pilimelia terevasa]